MMGVLTTSGLDVTELSSSILLFSEFFNIIEIHVSNCISRLCLAGVTAAELWNMNVIKRI